MCAAVFGLVLLCGCYATSAAADDIVGVWEHRSPDGEHAVLTFFSDGTGDFEFHSKDKNRTVGITWKATGDARYEISPGLVGQPFTPARIRENDTLALEAPPRDSTHPPELLVFRRVSGPAKNSRPR